MEQTARRQPLGNGKWFDIDRATRFQESTYWDGSNYISEATGSQWAHEDLFRTAQGGWVKKCWDNYGGTPTWEEIDAETAYRWLVRQGHSEVVPDAWLGEQEI